MAQDTEEALRVILVIGNAVIPASRDIIRLLARVSATVGRTGWKGGKLVAGAAMDRIDGMGTKGMVRNTARCRCGSTDHRCHDRPTGRDLHEMATLCRKLGVAFSVSDIVSDGKAEHTLIQFAAQDASHDPGCASSRPRLPDRERGRPGRGLLDARPAGRAPGARRKDVGKRRAGPANWSSAMRPVSP